MEFKQSNPFIVEKKIKKYFHITSWVIMFLSFILVVLHRFAISGLQNIFAENFSMSSTSFAILSSSYFYLYPLMQIPIGIALDLWGHRRIAVLSFLTMTCGALIFGSSTTFGQLLFGRMIISFGAAFVWGLMLKIQGLYFSGRIFAFLTGLGVIAGSIGVILAGSPFNIGVSYFGWRDMFYYLAAVSFLLLLGNLFFTRNPTYISNNKHITFMQKKEKTNWHDVHTALKHKASWLLFLCHFGVYGSYAAFIGIWGYPFLVGEVGYTVSQASFFITFLGL